MSAISHLQANPRVLYPPPSVRRQYRPQRMDINSRGHEGTFKLIWIHAQSAGELVIGSDARSGTICVCSKAAGGIADSYGSGIYMHLLSAANAAGYGNEIWGNFHVLSTLLYGWLEEHTYLGGAFWLQPNLSIYGKRKAARTVH
jgi:hypothetical protein